MTEMQKSTNWIMVIILWGIGVAAAAQFAKVSISLEALAQQYNISNSVAAVILTSIGILGIVLGAAAGMIVGAIGTRKSLVVALVIGILSSVLQAFLPSFYIFLFSRLVEGISHLLIVVAAPTAILSVTIPKQQSITMGLWATFFGVAYAISGYVGNTILAHGGISYLYFSHAGLILILMVLYLLLSKSASIVNQPPLMEELSKAWKSQFSVYRSFSTATPSYAFFWHTLMFVALLTFLPTFGNSVDEKRLLSTVLPLISIIGSFLGGAISQKSKSALKQLQISFAVLTAMAIAMWASIGSSSFFLAACLTMLTSGIVQASMFASVAELCKSETAQAQANGAITQLGNLGATCGSPIFAWVILQSGTGSVPLLAAFMALLATVTVTICISLIRPSQKESRVEG